MHSFIFQDWITVRTSGAITSVTQDEAQYLDLAGYQDLVFWLDVRENSGTNLAIAYQTSPTKDDSFFQDMVTAVTMTAAATPTVTKALLASATCPIARWLRWKVYTSSGTLSATFRVIAAANPSGG
jgi:hypothetical protein